MLSPNQDDTSSIHLYDNSKIDKATMIRALKTNIKTKIHYNSTLQNRSKTWILFVVLVKTRNIVAKKWERIFHHVVRKNLVAAIFKNY